MKKEILKYIQNKKSIEKKKIEELYKTNIEYSEFDIDIEINEFIENDNDVCWITSLVLPYIGRYKRNKDLKEFSLSMEYIVFWDLLEKCNAFFDNVVKSKNKLYSNEFVKTLFRNGINNGGDFSMVIDLIETYGVVEDDSSKVKEKDYGIICYKLTQMVREVGAKIRKEENKENINDIIKETMRDIYWFLNEEFYDIDLLKKENVNPLELKNEIFGKDLETKVVITTVLSDNVKYNEKYKLVNNGYLLRKESMEYYNVDPKSFKEIIIEQLKEKQCVPIGCDSRTGYNEKINVFNSNKNVDKKEGFNSKNLRINHCLLLSGVKFNNDIPVYYKAINDWNNNCFDVVTDKWFNNYVLEALIDKKYIANKIFETKNIKSNNNDFYN